MNIETANKVISKYEPLVVLCTYNILFTNDICCGQIMDGVQQMKRTPYYRQSFKRCLNDADKARRGYERKLNGVIADRSEYFADSNEMFEEEVGRDVEMLYWRFKQVLDDNAVAYSAELARFELARTLTEYACLLFDRRMNELKEKDARFKRFTMEYIRLTNVSRLMNLASDNLGVGQTVDMNTEQCKLAFDVLVRKLEDVQKIANAINCRRALA